MYLTVLYIFLVNKGQFSSMAKHKVENKHRESTYINHMHKNVELTGCGIPKMQSIVTDKYIMP